MKWLKRLLGRTEEEPAVSLFCPYREDFIPIASEETEPVWEQEGESIYGYQCEVCGRTHCWMWGPPAPIYVGDKIILTFRQGASDSVVEA